MHTAEHILNATMVKMFGCPRSRNAHIERKKSKCDYLLAAAPTQAQVQAIEDKVNEVIHSNLDVSIEFVDRDHIPAEVDLSKLPQDASPTLRLVRIGSSDVCACVGAHVANTSEIGSFKSKDSISLHLSIHLSSTFVFDTDSSSTSQVTPLQIETI